MKILVTGGAGFIGSHLSRRLLQDGHQATVIDNLSTGCRENLPAEIEFIGLDLGAPNMEELLPRGPFDAVCHLAAQSSGAISVEDPVLDCNVNTLASLRLAQWCVKNGIPRFVFASSMAVYGNGPLPFSENQHCTPISPYGVSKLAAEQYLGILASQGLSVTNLRMFNVYGPGQNLSNLKQGMLSIYLAILEKGDSLTVTGPLDRTRDFVYISDVIDAWMLALKHPELPEPTYNLGSGVSHTVGTVIKMLIENLRLPKDHSVHSSTSVIGDQSHSVANIERICRDLGWHPKIDLEYGMREMISWAAKLH